MTITTIGIIGSGEVAQALARHALGAGYAVSLSNSRGPDSLAETVAALGDGAPRGHGARGRRQPIWSSSPSRSSKSPT